MKNKLISLYILIIFLQSNFAQNKIHYNDQDLFLSGTNLAWISFANDVGKGNYNIEEFSDILLQIHENGGNSLGGGLIQTEMPHQNLTLQEM